MREVIIVGASAAGLRCACRLARLKPRWKITVLEARQTFSYAACGLPYVLSGEIGEAEALRRTDYRVIRDAQYFADYKRVTVLTGHRVAALDVSGRRLEVRGPNGAAMLPWDELVLATGARAITLKGQPRDSRVGAFHSLDDLERLHSGLANGEIQRVALIGAGPVGCELAEAFRSLWGAEVVIVEASPAPLPSALDPDLAASVAGQIRANGVDLLVNSPVTGIDADDDGVTITAGDESVRAQAVVVAIGVEPVVELARQAGAKLAACGAIAVDERLATSLPGIWAVGDCVAVRHAVTGEHSYMPLGSLANRQGRSLANILAGRADHFPPAAGAVAIKVFDWNVASVGCTTAEARSHGLPVRAARTFAQDRALYWPEVKDIQLKLLYNPESRRVLGVQAAGEGEVVKRVDVATQLITRGATLEEFAHLEHAHAPPFAPAMEPLAVAAMIAQNQEDGIEAASPQEISTAGSLLDVRSIEEAAESPVSAGYVSRIPLDELISRLEEVEKSTELVVCGRGTRSAEAVRLLLNNGIRARYLSGGLRWLAAMRHKSDDS